ncbi:hypothetical protein PS838_00578 [Pseudomonas fluorescens]|jgi:Asp-tRNA(Asn)/Glu-tRNA(Gln) amidotransferase A subunit family amidase|nr:hypothetical protein PS838_00578 [Pseudomonas fluorescens]
MAIQAIQIRAVLPKPSLPKKSKWRNFDTTRRVGGGGFPEITVPAGTIKGNLPVGVAFLGGYGEDAKVVGFGYAFLGH